MGTPGREDTAPGVDITELTPLEDLAIGSPALIVTATGDLGTKASAVHPNPGNHVAALENQGVLVRFHPEDSVQFLATKYHLETVVLDSEVPDPAVRDALPEEIVRKYRVLPLKLEQGRLTLVIANPTDLSIDDAVKFNLGHAQYVFVLDTAESIDRAIEQCYGTDLVREAERAGDALAAPVDNSTKEEAEQWGKDQRIIIFVDGVLSSAIKARASDIHFEVFRGFFQIRFRIDGMLHILPLKLKFPVEMHRMIVSRIKILAELDISIKDRAQDGRLSRNIDGKDMEFRVSITPTQFGERVVLRKSSSIEDDKLTIDDLGFREDEKKAFLKAIGLSQGMILITGPTGSGKTTTLAAALMKLNDPSINIMTAEDPIEITIPGVGQQAMNAAKGVTFSEALRSFLRQDPDVIMVGEIRDFDTADVAVKASITGHLVFSTLHTNNAIQSISRILDLGVQAFLFIPALTMVCAQRLVRRICPRCDKKKSDVSLGQLVEAGFTEEVALKLVLQEPIGREKPTVVGQLGRNCRHCEGTGFRGRVAIYEMMYMTRELRAAFLSGRSTDEILPLAQSQGMLTLRQSGLIKVREGITTLAEVVRVTPAD